MNWAAFWIFLAIVYTADALLFSQGLDTLFFKHKTKEEKQRQELKLLLLETDLLIKQVKLNNITKKTPKEDHY